MIESNPIPAHAKIIQPNQFGSDSEQMIDTLQKYSIKSMHKLYHKVI